MKDMLDFDVNWSEFRLFCIDLQTIGMSCFYYQYLYIYINEHVLYIVWYMSVYVYTMSVYYSTCIKYVYVYKLWFVL